MSKDQEQAERGASTQGTGGAGASGEGAARAGVTGTAAGGRRAHAPTLGARVGGFVEHVWAYFAQDAMPRMAAALAYRTMFSLIPLLLLSLLTLRLFKDDKALVHDFLQRTLQQTGIQLVARPESGGGPGPGAEKPEGADAPTGGAGAGAGAPPTGAGETAAGGGEATVLAGAPERLPGAGNASGAGAADGAPAGAEKGAGTDAPKNAESVGAASKSSPEAKSDISKTITDLVSKFQGINFGAIGIVSAATLIYAALSLLVEIESSFNALYGAPRGRSWSKRILQYWLIVSLGPLTLYLGFLAGDQFASVAKGLAGSGGALAGPWLVRLSGFAVTVTITMFLLLVLYMTFPNTKVRFRPALLGAFVGGVLLEVAKFAFAKYFSAEGYKTVFGALFLLPLFLLWIYVLWFVVLFGLRVSFLTQHGRTGVLLGALRASSSGGGGLGGAWIEPARSVSVAVAVAEAFARGEPATAHRLAEAAGLSDGQARTLLNGLEDAGLVHRIASERGPGPRSESFALSRPPETIAVAEVVEVGQSLSGPVTGGTGGELIAKIRRAQIDAVSGVTLASLVKVPGAKGSASATAKPSAPQPAPPSTAVPTAASMAATDPSLPNVATAANGHAHGKAAAVSAGEPTANLPSEPRTEPRP